MNPIAIPEDLERRIQRSVEEHVRVIPTPAPDVAALTSQGRRRRRIRTISTTTASMAAAAAVVLVATSFISSGTAPGRQPRGPGSTNAAAAGPPMAAFGARGPATVDAPRQVFVSAENVWMDGHRRRVAVPFDTESKTDLDGPAPLFLEASSSSLHLARDGLVFPGVGNRPMVLTRDGRTEPLAPAEPTLPGAVYDDWVAADPAGPLVAWDEYDGSTVRVVVYDTAARRVVGTRFLRCDGSFASGCQRPYVVSDGIVFISGHEELAWDPVNNTTTDIGGQLIQARNRVVQAGGGEGPKPDLSALAGGWSVAREDDAVQGNLSFDGAWLLDNSGTRSLVVNWRTPEQVIRYDLPRHATEAVFDTDGSVLVVSHDQKRYTGWDCALATGCQVVVPAQLDEIRLVGWDT